MASRSRGLILMERAIFFSSSSCSLVLDISLWASLAPSPTTDFLVPAPAFWASSISCLLASVSSSFFFFSSASTAFLSASSFLAFSSSSFFCWLIFFFLLGSDLLPLSLLLLQLLELLLLLLPGLPPFCDVFLEGGVQSLLLLCLFFCHDCTFQKL